MTSFRGHQDISLFFRKPGNTSSPKALSAPPVDPSCCKGEQASASRLSVNSAAFPTQSPGLSPSVSTYDQHVLQTLKGVPGVLYKGSCRFGYSSVVKYMLKVPRLDSSTTQKNKISLFQPHSATLPYVCLNKLKVLAYALSCLMAHSKVIDFLSELSYQ